MVPFTALLRRHRFLLLLLSLVAGIFFFTGAIGPSASTTTRPYGPEFRPGGLGTGSLDEWADEDLKHDEIVPAKGSWLQPWKASPRFVLITGGAGSLGQMLAPKLIEAGYTVHVLDIVARPATLHAGVVYHRGSVLSDSKPLETLQRQYTFDGIVHFAAASLDAWCAPKPEACSELNVGGTKAVLAAVEGALSRAASGGKWSWSVGKKDDTAPWVLLASSMDVYGSAESGAKTVVESTAQTPTTELGKTKAAAELELRKAFERARMGAGSGAVQLDSVVGNDMAPMSGGGPGGAHLRAAIVRFSELYGYPRDVSIPSAFIPRLLQHAVSSLPIQYSSDEPAKDMLHVQDAVSGVVKIIQHMDNDNAAGNTALESYNLVKGGKRWMAGEIIDVLRSETQSMSPVRDIGDSKASLQGVAEYSYAHAREALGWTPEIDLPYGLALATTNLAEASEQYAHDFIQHHCPHLSSVQAGDAAMVPEDERNRHLYRLDNCTVNLGFNREGWLSHFKCRDGKHCGADLVKVDSYNWDSTVWVIETVGTTKRPNGRATMRFRQEDGNGYLGVRDEQLGGRPGGEITFELFKDGDTAPHHREFDVEVAPDSSSLRILVGDGAHKMEIHSGPGKEPKQASFVLESPSSSPSHYDMRMTVLCCESEGDWPLLLDDHESADIRFGTAGDIPFNASRRLHLCSRAEQAHKYFADMAIASKKTAAAAHTADKPVVGRPARTNKQPDAWALKQLRPCWNDCNSPTVCMQTGNCRCVQADSCPRRRENPLIALARGIRTGPVNTNSPLGQFKGFDPILANMVAKVDWKDVLLPEARAYINAHPDLIKVHVADGYERQWEIESKPCHLLQTSHCFSADSIMYKAMRKISVPAKEADLVVLPVYQHCSVADGNKTTNADFILHDVYHHASQTVDGLESKVPVSMVMTHDWGICLSFVWELWSSREGGRHYPDPILKNSIVFSVQGDWESACYRPAQDVVVPARTCRTPDLVETFPDVKHIKPVAERQRLVAWSGTMWGTGKSERLRMTCHRGGVADRPVADLPDSTLSQSLFYSWEYMDVLGNSRFCPQPRGVAGWSPRVNDAIYAGCIPVLTCESTHYPFASMLDWSQFSVRVHPTELDQIERILSAIPIERVEQLQANLVAVRDAFLYPDDEHPEHELTRRGPMFWALQEAGMRIRTVYPEASK